MDPDMIRGKTSETGSAYASTYGMNSGDVRTWSEESVDVVK